MNKNFIPGALCGQARTTQEMIDATSTAYKQRNVKKEKVISKQLHVY